MFAQNCKFCHHVILLLIICVCYVCGFRYGHEEEFTDPLEYVKEDGVYYNLNSILDFFHQDEFRESIGVKELLQRYQDSIKRWEERAGSGKTPKIFIAVEGINPHNRKVSAQILAQKIGGKYLVAPTRAGLGPILDDQKARKAYHALNKYATANYVRLISLYQPVIMQKYWFDHASFIMAKRFKDFELPPANSSIYQFPEDLLKPNITFFINDANFNRMSTTQEQFTKKLIRVFRYFREPSVTEITCRGPPRLIVQKMMDILNEYNTYEDQEGKDEEVESASDDEDESSLSVQSLGESSGKDGDTNHTSDNKI